MSKDSLFWSIVGASALATAIMTTYACTGGFDAAIVAPKQAASQLSRQSPARRQATLHADPRAKKRLPASGALRERRTAIEAALQRYVITARGSSQDNRATPPATELDEGSGMPLVEMTVEQYQTWARYGDALAARDYRKTEGLLPEVERQLGRDAAQLMAMVMVRDYQRYLDEVIDAQCQGHDPDSVWRKTLFMPFVLARLEQSTEELDHKASEARELCGYEA
jgi:hypothetical protein